MLEFDDINEGNIDLYCMQHYDNPQCISTDEYNDDMKRFKYLKRHLNHYLAFGELKERLILNHLIVLNNLFGVEHAIRMLLYKIEEEYWPVLKTCLIYLEYVEENWKLEVPLDKEVINRLREL